MKIPKSVTKPTSFAIGIVVTWALLVFSCSNPVGNSDTDSSRIVWGEHIEGVHIGDDSATVVQKLGPPSYMIGGDFSGWTFYYAEDTDYHRMTIKISQDSALHPGVFSLILWPPYDGTAKQRVGLGMERKEVLKHLSKPDSTQLRANGTIYDSYYYEKNTFFARYDKDKGMNMMGMGIPLHYH